MPRDDLLQRIDHMRAQGRSATEACRAVGVSVSTYYRRRKQEAPPAAPHEANAALPPLVVDELFAGEAEDSFIRREAGYFRRPSAQPRLGVSRRAPGLSLGAMLAPPRRSRHARARLTQMAAALALLGVVATAFSLVDRPPPAIATASARP